jgi:hypothetical protein
MPETYESSLNVTQATYLDFLQQYKDADEAVAEAVGERKALRKTIKGAGINLKAFDRQRKDAEKSGEVREEEDREYRRYMAWCGKPVGFQPDMFPERTASDERAMAEYQATQAEEAGEIAGKNGVDRARNPWTPGTFLWEQYDRGWMRGQEILAATLTPSDSPKLRGRKTDGATAH